MLSGSKTRAVTPRKVWHLALLLCLFVAVAGASNARRVTGTYRNYAEGFSVEVPKGLEGVAGDADGPERGLRIPLQSGGSISIYGEPNSLEWKSADEGVRWMLTVYKCGSEQKPSSALIGSVRGASGPSICKDRFIAVLLAFRPKGGPIYWFILKTSANHRDDKRVLERVAESFKIIAWK